MCGGGVIVRNSGDRDMLVSGGLVIDNNSFHGFEKMHLTYKPAILLQEAVGAQITHNEIYDGIHSGIIYGNAEFQRRFPYDVYVRESGKYTDGMYLDNLLYYVNNKIEYNFIHDLFTTTIVGDAGSIYIPRSVADAGNEINYNIIGNNKFGPWGLYLDDGMGNVSVKGNIFYNPGMYSIFMSAGSYNNISNNICIFTSSTNSTLRIWPKYAEMLYEGMDRINSSPTWSAFLNSYNKIPTSPEAQAIWREKWPQLFLVAENLTVSEDRVSDKYCPTNTIGCTIVDNYTFTKKPYIDMSNNNLGDIRPDPETEVGKYFYLWNSYEDTTLNSLSVANEYFVNASDGNYTIKDGCGIEDNHFDKIGRY
jgi:parallel beta-helix repeat protein